MGKIVKRARVVSDRYVLEVPEAGTITTAPPHAFNGELDDRFAPHDDDLLPFSGGEVSLEEPMGLVEAHPQIDWAELRAQAAAIVDKAAEGSEAMLRDAAARARELIASAEAQSAAMFTAAQSHGHEEGVSAGRAEIERQLAETVASLKGVVDEARAQRVKFLEGAEPEIVKLAMTVAERIVHEQISVDPNVVLENVRSALTRLVGREVVTLRVNPADLETIRAHRESIASSNDVEHLRIVEDQRVDRGGVVVETDSGTIDAKISTQVREARRTLLSEPTIFSPAQAS